MNVEQCWTLTGGRIGGIWVGWRRWPTSGAPASVEFSAKRSLQRNRYQHDLLGWMHTHPGMSAVPSSVDVATMRAWCFALGRRLLCLIDGSDGLRGYVFHNDECYGVEVMKVYSLGFGIVVAIEHGRAHGG